MTDRLRNVAGPCRAGAGRVLVVDHGRSHKTDPYAKRIASVPQTIARRVPRKNPVRAPARMGAPCGAVKIVGAIPPPRLGLDGLITNNYKVLDVPTEIAAIVKTKMLVVAIEGLGHDPLRAVGALLLELPGLADRIRPRTSNVFRLAYRRRAPEEAWTYLQRAAERLGEEPRALWRRVGVSDDELARTVFADA